jgi:hypothetical protein
VHFENFEGERLELDTFFLRKTEKSFSQEDKKNFTILTLSKKRKEEGGTEDGRYTASERLLVEKSPFSNKEQGKRIEKREY